MPLDEWRSFSGICWKRSNKVIRRLVAQRPPSHQRLAALQIGALSAVDLKIQINLFYLVFLFVYNLAALVMLATWEHWPNPETIVGTNSLCTDPCPPGSFVSNANLAFRFSSRPNRLQRTDTDAHNGAIMHNSFAKSSNHSSTALPASYALFRTLIE